MGDNTYIYAIARYAWSFWAFVKDSIKEASCVVVVDDCNNDCDQFYYPKRVSLLLRPFHRRAIWSQSPRQGSQDPIIYHKSNSWRTFCLNKEKFLHINGEVDIWNQLKCNMEVKLPTTLNLFMAG